MKTDFGVVQQTSRKHIMDCVQYFNGKIYLMCSFASFLGKEY